MPDSKISTDALAKYDIGSVFVVYCWGSGCHGAAKAALNMAALGYGGKEMLCGIHYKEGFERSTINRRDYEAQS